MDVDLLAHVNKEENGLFDYIKKLVAISKNPEAKLDIPLRTDLEPADVMVSNQEKIHEQIGDYFEEIKDLSSEYTLPVDACGSYNLFYRLLKEFEDDLILHVHLENNILFPKALALEVQLKN